MISLPAVLMTIGWIVLVGAILAAFGRTVGGAWSIAGSVARGVTEWAGHRRDTGSRGASPAAVNSPGGATSRATATSPASPPAAETEDL